MIQQLRFDVLHDTGISVSCFQVKRTSSTKMFQHVLDTFAKCCPEFYMFLKRGTGSMFFLSISAKSFRGRLLSIQRDRLSWDAKELDAVGRQRVLS